MTLDSFSHHYHHEEGEAPGHSHHHEEGEAPGDSHHDEEGEVAEVVTIISFC